MAAQVIKYFDCDAKVVTNQRVDESDLCLVCTELHIRLGEQTSETYTVKMKHMRG